MNGWGDQSYAFSLWLAIQGPNDCHSQCLWLNKAVLTAAFAQQQLKQLVAPELWAGVQPV
jgi:hypothetical protein